MLIAIAGVSALQRAATKPGEPTSLWDLDASFLSAFLVEMSMESVGLSKALVGALFAQDTPLFLGCVYIYGMVRVIRAAALPLYPTPNGS